MAVECPAVWQLFAVALILHLVIEKLLQLDCANAGRQPIFCLEGKGSRGQLTAHRHRYFPSGVDQFAAEAAAMVTAMRPGTMVSSQRVVMLITLASSSSTWCATNRSSTAFGRLSASRRRRSGLPAAIVITAGPDTLVGLCSFRLQPASVRQAS